MKCKICGSKTETWYKKLYDDRHGYLGYFDLEKCTNCGFAQTNPQIPKTKIARLYSDYYPRQRLDISNLRKRKGKLPSRFNTWLSGNLNKGHWWIKPNSNVLDVGSGLGIHLMEIEALGANAYGIDPDNNAKKAAEKLGLKFHQGFIEDSPFKGVKFDYVTTNQVIEHTNDPVKFLSICKKRLNKNGKMILSFPNTNSLTRKVSGKNWLHWHVPYHLNHFNKKSVHKIAELSNLRIVELKTFTPNLWTNLQIRRLINKPPEGKRDTYWDPGKSKKISNNNFVDKLFKRTFEFLNKYNLLNRIIDSLGYGDSFLVILETK